jgi:alpha-beta hydrolase superfamily lysophospholipase
MAEDVHLYSDGIRLAGRLYLPAERRADERRPGVVVCQGFGGTMEYNVAAIAEALAAVGYVALIFDYRGFGLSDGPRWRLIPPEQARDARAALAYLATRPEVEAARLGIYGTSFGGGVAIVAAAAEPAVRCVVSTVGVGNGLHWMRSMRRYWEWVALLERLEADRRRRVLSGESELVDPDEILVRDPEAQAWNQEILRQYPSRRYQLPLETAEAVIAWRPDLVVGQLAPRALLVIHVGGDRLVPPEQAEELYANAGEPKRLAILPRWEHHDVYQGEAFAAVMRETLPWFAAHLPVS